MISTTTPGATIHYTEDGTNPTTASVVYANPISVASNKVIRAMAVAPGFSQSTVSVATYTIDIQPGQTAPVAFAPSSGEYNNPVAVGLSTETQPSTICYTLDGSTPTCNNGQCTGTAAPYSAGSPLPIDAPTGGGALTVKAMACSDGNSNSEVTTSIYTFKTAPVIATPGSGELALNSTIALATATANQSPHIVNIRWNWTDTNPTCTLSDVTVTAPATSAILQQNTVFNTIACRPNYQPSDVRRYAYTTKLTDPVIDPGSVSGVQNDPFTPTVTAGVAPNPTTPSAAGCPNAGCGFTPPTPGNPATTAFAAPPANGSLCFRLGADPICTAAGLCDTTTGPNPGSQTAPPLNDNTLNNVRVRTCRPGYEPSEVVAATYTFTVADVSVTAPDNTITNYDATTSPIIWNDGANGSTINLTLDSVGTTGETIRYSIATGNNLPAPPDVTCAQACNGDASCSVFTAGALNGTPAFTTIKAIGCKDNYVSSPPRTIQYVDPTLVVGLALTPLTGTYNNDVEVTLTSEPPQPATKNVGQLDANDVHICYTVGVNNLNEPTCDTVTGACTNGIEYNPCDGVSGCGAKVRPIVSQTGTTLKAIACKAGVPNPSQKVEATYTLKVATPTFTPNGGTINFDSRIDFATTTTGATTNYRRSDANAQALAPDCTSPNPTGQVTAAFINEFDADCGPDGLGGQCAPNEQVKIIGCKAGYENSDVATADFNANLGPPTITPLGTPDVASRTNEVTVTISHPTFTGTGIPGGKVCYTTNGGTPDCNPDASCGGGGNVKPITGPDPVVIGNAGLPSGTVIKAIACATGYPKSTVVESTYNFHVQPYAVVSTTSGGGTTIRFVNNDADPPTANNAPTTGSNNGADRLVVCYSKDSTEITFDSDCVAENPAAPAPPTVFCSSSDAASTFHNAGGNWTPADLTDIGTSINQLKSKACKPGFVQTQQRNDPFIFGPYSRPEPMDNTNTFDSNENGFTVLKGAGAPAGNDSGYVSWDGDNIYVGYQGPGLKTDPDQVFHFYILGNHNAGTMNGDNLPDVGGADEFGSAVAPPVANVNWHFYMTPAGGPASAAVRVWDGAGWVNPGAPAPAAPVFEARVGGTLNNGGGQVGYIEWRISRAGLGLTGDAQLVLMGGVWDPDTADQRWFPTDALGAPTNRKYLDANMGASNFPSFGGYKKP